jgi:[ribosomal protein S5]-alanine N-acetyltransferase
MTEPSIVCETEQLVLRPVTIEDADFAFQMTADPEVSQFLGGVRTLDWHIHRIMEMVEHQRVHGFSRYVVVLKSTGEAVGRCGLIFKEIEGVPEVELGYVYTRPQWGHGYATEAARSVLRHAFRCLGQQRIVAIIHPGNHASIRVAEKIGMTYERIIESDGKPARLYAARTAEPVSRR